MQLQTFNQNLSTIQIAGFQNMTPQSKEEKMFFRRRNRKWNHGQQNDSQMCGACFNHRWGVGS